MDLSNFYKAGWLLPRLSSSLFTLPPIFSTTASFLYLSFDQQVMQKDPSNVQATYTPLSRPACRRYSQSFIAQSTLSALKFLQSPPLAKSQNAEDKSVRLIYVLATLKMCILTIPSLLGAGISFSCHGGQPTILSGPSPYTICANGSASIQCAAYRHL
jgi:hypothetical protein